MGKRYRNYGEEIHLNRQHDGGLMKKNAQVSQLGNNNGEEE